MANEKDLSTLIEEEIKTSSDGTKWRAEYGYWFMNEKTGKVEFAPGDYRESKHKLHTNYNQKCWFMVNPTAP